MARPKNISPTYRRHRDSARCWVNGRWIDLGKYTSDDSKAEFARIVAEHAVAPKACVAPKAGTLSVNQVLAAFWTHAQEHYRRADGTHTSEIPSYRDSFRPVRRLYGHTPVTKFGPLALKAIRQTLIDEGLSRKVINQRIGRIKRAFKWAASEQLVPIEAYQSLTTVVGLQTGRTKARESEPIKPVSVKLVDATLAFLNRHLRAMIELQRLTGMRPGEVCAMRLADVDRSGPLWVYRPQRHKTAHHGKERVVMIGPRGRAVLEAFIASGRVVDPSGPLFSPRRAREERFDELREKRKSKVQPSQVSRRKAKPKLQPAEAYTPGAYAHSVWIAAEKAFPLPGEMARRWSGPQKEKPKEWRARLRKDHAAEMKAWRRVHHWHPNQLRHLYASEVRKAHGLEAAQVLLGHASANITQVYAERDLTLAAAVAEKIG